MKGQANHIDNMDVIEKLLVLEKNSLFKTLAYEQRYAIADELPTIEVFQGDIIFEPGDGSQSMYIICSGQVEISHDGKVDEILVEGDYIGELRLFSDENYRTKAKCLADGVLMVIDASLFKRIITEFPQLLSLMAHRIVGYLTQNQNQGVSS